MSMRSSPGVQEKPFVKLLVNKGSELVDRVTASTRLNLKRHSLTCVSVGCGWMTKNLVTKSDEVNYKTINKTLPD